MFTVSFSFPSTKVKSLPDTSLQHVTHRGLVLLDCLLTICTFIVWGWCVHAYVILSFTILLPMIYFKFSGFQPCTHTIVSCSVPEFCCLSILQETLVFKEKQLQKFFKTGDHVKVIAGTHDGATGMIVKVQNNVITIHSDTSREDVSPQWILLHRNMTHSVQTNPCILHHTCSDLYPRALLH